jgi:hypothetical protein
VPEEGPAEDGEIVARVRVRAAVSEKHAPSEAELVVRVARESHGASRTDAP